MEGAREACGTLESVIDTSLAAFDEENKVCGPPSLRADCLEGLAMRGAVLTQRGPLRAAPFFAACRCSAARTAPAACALADAAVARRSPADAVGDHPQAHGGQGHPGACAAAPGLATAAHAPACRCMHLALAASSCCPCCISNAYAPPNPKGPARRQGPCAVARIRTRWHGHDVAAGDKTYLHAAWPLQCACMRPPCTPLLL